MTDQELDAIADAHRWDTREGRRQMIRAALAAPAPQPEPVGHVEGGVLVRSSLPPGYTGPLFVSPSAGDARQPEIDRLNSERLDLACLVLRLIRRMRAARVGEGMAAGDDALEQQALGYLQRKGLSASPLRDGGKEEATAPSVKHQKPISPERAHAIYQRACQQATCHTDLGLLITRAVEADHGITPEGKQP